MAVMWTVIVKNDSGSAQDIDDLGIYQIADSTQRTLSDDFDFSEIANSDNLRDLVQAGTLVINDGSSDLSAAAGVAYLKLAQGSHLLDAAGRHNADQIAVEGSYTNLGSPADVESALSALDSDIASLNSHLADDSSYKHDTDQIHADGTYTNFTDDQDLESLLQELDTILTGIGGGNTLDEAYDEGGAGAGRTINADSGPVKLDRGSSTDASFEIVPKAAVPTTNLAGGQIDILSGTGMPFVYDATRSKYLSLSRITHSFGRIRGAANQYLRIYGGGPASIRGGIRIPYNATIVSISVQLDASGTCDVYIRKNDAATNIATLAVTAAAGDHEFDTDVDVDAGDFLQCYLSATTAVEAPTVVVELAYRA